MEITLALLFLSPQRTPAAQQQPDLGDFDAFVTKAMQAFKVPGAAIASVKNGKIILADGFALELAFLPPERLGVVILTNLDGTAFRDQMAYKYSIANWA